MKFLLDSNLSFCFFKDYSMDYIDPDEYKLNTNDLDECYRLCLEKSNFTSFTFQRINSACILKRSKVNPIRCADYSVCMDMPGKYLKQNQKRQSILD